MINRKRILIVLGSILVIGLISGGIYYSTKMESKDTTVQVEKKDKKEKEEKKETKKEKNKEDKKDTKKEDKKEVSKDKKDEKKVEKNTTKDKKEVKKDEKTKSSDTKATGNNANKNDTKKESVVKSNTNKGAETVAKKNINKQNNKTNTTNTTQYVQKTPTEQPKSTPTNTNKTTVNADGSVSKTVNFNGKEVNATIYYSGNVYGYDGPVFDSMEEADEYIKENINKDNTIAGWDYVSYQENGVEKTGVSFYEEGHNDKILEMIDNLQNGN